MKRFRSFLPKGPVLLIEVSIILYVILLLISTPWSLSPQGMGKLALTLSETGSRVLLFCFWSFWLPHWFYFWLKLGRFFFEPYPQRILCVSVFCFFLIAAFIVYSPERGQGAFFLSHALVRDWLWRGIQYAGSFTYLPLVFANAALMVGSHRGWEKTDPVESSLKKTVRWPDKPKHAEHRKTALNMEETYIGFEATKRAPVFLTSEERNRHTQVVGTTGSGKTRFVLFPMVEQDIEQGRGVVFVDAKGSSENAAVLYDMAKKAGREKDFVLFSLTQTDQAGTYNPLQYGNASQLKDKITASIDWSEPFYQRVCESALQTLFRDLESQNRRITLPQLHAILKTPPTSLKNFFALAEKNASNIKTLFSEIDLLVNTPFGHLFKAEKAKMDLMDVYTKGKIAYFALDTQSYQHTAVRMGKIITQDLNTLSGLIESTFSEKEKRSLAVYIDEYQAFGTKGFINALARGRSSGFWITIAHQSLGDLKAVDESYAQQVFENTNTKIVLRVNDPETAQFFSDSIGTFRTVDTTSQVRIEGEDPKNIMGSRRIVHEYLVHPMELKNLETGQAAFKAGRRHGRLCLQGMFPTVENPWPSKIKDATIFPACQQENPIDPHSPTPRVERKMKA